MSIGLPSGVVAVHPYTPDWPRLFEEEKKRLLACIGNEVLDIQHIGSTSVPGLPAKPILDIGVAVANFEAAARCIAPVETLGYAYRGELGIARRHYFTRGEPCTHQLHMNEIHSDDWKKTLAFRDYVRRHPEAARVYALLKQHLAQKFPTDILAYTDGKSDFIQQILKLAAVA